MRYSKCRRRAASSQGKIYDIFFFSSSHGHAALYLFFSVLCCVASVRHPSSLFNTPHGVPRGHGVLRGAAPFYLPPRPPTVTFISSWKVGGSSVNPCDVDYLELGIGCSGGKGTLGMDMSGTVVAVGSGTTGRLKVGDQVWTDIGGGSGDTGAMAEYSLVAEAQAGLKPQSLNFTEAGTVPLVGLTAIEMLQKTGAPWTERKNVTVAVTSGSGGTGFMAVQLAKHLYNAATVVTATSGDDAIAFVKSIGADVVVDYKVKEIFDALPDDSVDIVIDNYGAQGTADKAMRTIRAGGVYLILPGGNGGTVSKHPKAGVKQINFGYTSSSDHGNLDIMKDAFDAGKLVAHVFAAFNLEAAAQAFALNKAGNVVGKVAVTAA